MKKSGLIYILLSFLLAACGGGGGGGSSTDPMPMLTDMVRAEYDPQVGQTAFRGSQSRGTDFISQASSSFFSAAEQPNNPIFGSVVQSYEVNISPVSEVDTDFDGTNFALRINRQDGSSTTLDTNSDQVSDVVEYTGNQNPVSNRPAVEGYVGRVGQNSGTVAGVTVEWSNTDPTDYLAGGYWMHVDNQSQVAEIGAFIDGPDYDDNVDMPVTGTAAYTGGAGGVYLTRLGTGIENLPAGTIKQGEYHGDLSLTADFGANTISGNINNIDFFYRYALTPDGNVYPLQNILSSGYEIHLGSASFDQAGQFVGQNISVTHPTIGIASTSGSWAGRFSTVDDSFGNPRGVAGTHRGEAIDTDGANSIFVGAHYGATERFD